MNSQWRKCDVVPVDTLLVEKTAFNGLMCPSNRKRHDAVPSKVPFQCRKQDAVGPMVPVMDNDDDDDDAVPSRVASSGENVMLSPQ